MTTDRQVPELILKSINDSAVVGAYEGIAKTVAIAAMDTGIPSETIRQRFYERYPGWKSTLP